MAALRLWSTECNFGPSVAGKRSVGQSTSCRKRTPTDAKASIIDRRWSTFAFYEDEDKDARCSGQGEWEEGEPGEEEEAARDPLPSHRPITSTCRT